MGLLIDLGETEIATRFSCKPEKVRVDLGSAIKLCDLLNKDK